MPKKREKENKEKEDKNIEDKDLVSHWADAAADNIIKKKGNKKGYVIASGITPSGVVHLGNFREVITADLIKRALEKRGKKVRFIYSWDDYDVFRKVPKNMPKQAELLKELRKPVFLVHDPFDKHSNYAEHFEKEFESELPKLGINPEYIYQHKEYLKCRYAESIKKALENEAKIREILDKYRQEPWDEKWKPYFVFCEKCNKDTIKESEWLGDYKIRYVCQCGHEDTFDFRKKGIVTLRWRIDWPMRWDYYQEDFESAGKDHFAAGGSVTTGRLIQKEVYGSDNPEGFMYEWIAIKGGGQFASSEGIVITIPEMLEVYQPEIIRYLFASTRPNTTFNISFDLDVIKIYEDFDKCERIYYGKENVNEKEKLKYSRIYELSVVGKISKKIPFQPSFRHLTLILQIHELDVKGAVGYYEKQLTDEDDKNRLHQRAECAKRWIEKYAPEEFKFSVQQEVSSKLKKTVHNDMKKVFHDLAKRIEEKQWDDKSLHEEFYVLINKYKLDNKEFFKTAYNILINKDKGPLLANFILTIGKHRVANLFKSI